MYFLIKGTYQDKEGCSNFDCVVEADNKEAAIAQLEKEETLVSIREISVKECIEREERDLLESIKREYIHQIVGNLTVREANKHMKELNSNEEIYYLALKSFNKRQRLMRVLKRQKGVGELSITEYAEVLNKLINAQTEEEFNKVLTDIKK